MSAPGRLALDAYPNPIHDQVTLNVFSPQAELATFEVVDLTGPTQRSRKQESREGLNKVEFRLGTLPLGIYLIRATDAVSKE